MNKVQFHKPVDYLRYGLAYLILLLVNIVIYFLIVTVGPVVFLYVLSLRTFQGQAVEYMSSVMVSGDQHGGALMFGTEDWTISSNLYRFKEEGFWWLLRYAVNFSAYNLSIVFYKLGMIDDEQLKRQKKHCESAYIKELSEFRYKAEKSVSVLHFDELKEWFLDDTNDVYVRLEDDGTKTFYMCCDWEIISKQGNKVVPVIAGSCGTGINFNPVNKQFYIAKGV